MIKSILLIALVAGVASAQYAYNYGYYPSSNGYQYGVASYYNQPSYAYAVGNGVSHHTDGTYSSYHHQFPAQSYKNVNGVQYVSSSVQPVKASGLNAADGYQSVAAAVPVARNGINNQAARAVPCEMARYPGCDPITTHDAREPINDQTVAAPVAKSGSNSQVLRAVPCEMARYPGCDPIELRSGFTYQSVRPVPCDIARVPGCDPN